MKLPHIGVQPHSSEEEPLSIAIVVVNKPLVIIVFVQVAPIAAHLVLRVDILEKLGTLPPIWAGLNHDSVWLDVLNQLLRPLGEHS